MWFNDYHVHTNFSADSESSMEDQCRAAILAGVAQIAFTEHEDYNPGDFTSFYFKHEDYLRKLEVCRRQFGRQLTILAGIEVSEPHVYVERAGYVLNKFDWDFVLGSLHWVHSKHNCYINDWVDAFGGWREAYRAYFLELQTLAAKGDFDVLAHIDYQARYAPPEVYAAYRIEDFEDVIRPTLAHLIVRGKGIEINTSALRRGLANPNPPAIVVKWFHEMGGTILTLGSDSHNPRHTGFGISIALEMARSAGFSKLATFQHRQVTLCNID